MDHAMNVKIPMIDTAISHLYPWFSTSNEEWLYLRLFVLPQCRILVLLLPHATMCNNNNNNNITVKYVHLAHRQSLKLV